MSFDSQDNITLKASMPTFDSCEIDYYSFEIGHADPQASQSHPPNGAKRDDDLINQPQLSYSIQNTSNSKTQSLSRAQSISAVQKRVSLQMSAKLHRAAKLAALDEDETLNSLMIRLLRHYLSQRQNAS
tara:strand:- start:431 stop:817 length:387 start_codon:yes stop_codon:yes gene_type:complete